MEYIFKYCKSLYYTPVIYNTVQQLYFINNFKNKNTKGDGGPAPCCSALCLLRPGLGQSDQSL